jgi:hypothetical protein
VCVCVGGRGVASVRPGKFLDGMLPFTTLCRRQIVVEQIQGISNARHFTYYFLAQVACYFYEWPDLKLLDIVMVILKLKPMFVSVPNT